MSLEAWQQVQQAFQGESLGPVDIKGKGSLELFEVRPAGQ